ncbi:UDP-N-acetylmuramoyl-L-alanine--D-glutamate ligase [Thermorudis peleae]|uniref:UDP-N-acetylmuramoyl-L-alanine--D-glutamate ligase n=1 Tax=Thermorudis peleae TaxID=1382356 RepID=UPI00056FC5C6|nr:UDP-N-acetylmuramoyl-L-alanine--D-glutamate ligase [Thermorudis peleae]
MMPHHQLDLRGKRVLVMGLGTRSGGLGVTRWLVAQGAIVTVTDLRPAEALRESLAALEGLPITFVLGQHREQDFTQADIVVRNPAVPRESPWLALARAAGARIEMEMTLFFRACPAPIIGVTGTKGKTTTATLCAAMLRAWRPDTVLAGNLGRSALEMLPAIQPDTPVVLELSSWQLEGLGEHGMSPHIAILTSISEDHLDRYPSMAEYIEAKRHIARFQKPDDWFIVNADNPIAWSCRHTGRGQLVPFGRDQGWPTAAVLIGEELYWRRDSVGQRICHRSEIPLAGEHIAWNVLAAAAAALLRGAPIEAVREGLRQVQPIPHRLEPIAELNGVLFVNDSAATAPAAVLAALQAYRERGIVLIAGGAAKGVDLTPLAEQLAAASHVRAVVLLAGSATPAFAEALRAAGAPVLGVTYSMEEAVHTAVAHAQPGDVVLLSPGCASFGLFRDEFHRGESFRQVVQQLCQQAFHAKEGAG